MDTFRDIVYSVTRQIPSGKVATYGQIARLSGKPGAARAVGAYMRTNPDAPRTPCHRVVASDGSLTGYSGHGGVATKRILLEKEGVRFSGGRVSLKDSLWRV